MIANSRLPLYQGPLLRALRRPLLLRVPRVLLLLLLVPSPIGTFKIVVETEQVRKPMFSSERVDAASETICEDGIEPRSPAVSIMRRRARGGR
ncbi:hypothetical protein LZ32DRAFT_606824 [Colletotrichum eremochloae]|nr:hypothetical protein LZ32DRAFT_606824 [Colletotrichum eremochloae]